MWFHAQKTFTATPSRMRPVPNQNEGPYERLKTRLAALQRLQEQTEASHHKPEAHQRQTCSDPSEEGSFCGKVVRWAGGRSVCHLLTISGCPQDRKRFRPPF